MKRRFRQWVFILVLEFRHVGAEVLLVKVPVLKWVKHRESCNCVEVLHLFKFSFFDLDFYVIVNFLLKQSTQLELNVGLKPLARVHLEILPLGHF